MSASGDLQEKIVDRNMNKPTLLVTTYTPESQLRHPWQLFQEMARDLLAGRELAWRLFIRNISAQYRQSVLGYVWAFLPPLATMLIWVYLNDQALISVADPGVPYPVFVMVGTLLWQTFLDALNSPLKSVNESKAMLSKINFPREALIMAGVGEVLFNFLIRLVLLAGILVWFSVEIPSTAPLAAVGLCSIILLGLVFGVLLTPLGVLYGDIQRGVQIVGTFWFFLTPVVYPMPDGGLARTMVLLNPVTPLLVNTRAWLIDGGGEQVNGFWIVTAACFFMLLSGWLLYRISMPHLISRIGA